MTDSDVEDSIRDYVVREIAVSSDTSTIKDDTKLIESGILDSLSVLKLVIFIESRFGLKVAPDEVVADNFQTISAISAYIRTKQDQVSR